MAKQIATIKIGAGIDYAKVSERIKEFRGDCPNGLIETTPTIDGNMVMFKARVLKDKAKPESAEATGHAIGENKGAKAFEKLESIAVGRALALLGYMASGEIASSEEMEEFQEYVEDKKQEALLNFQAEVSAIKDLEALRVFYLSHRGLGKEFDQIVMNHSNLLKTPTA